MNWINFCRAVAAATGRRFKSSRRDQSRFRNRTGKKIKHDHKYEREMGQLSPTPLGKLMKIKGLIFSALLGSMTLTVHGQDAAPPAVDLYAPEKEPEVTATPFPEPNGPELPELSQLDEAFKQKSVSKEVDERRVHIEWRQLKNQVANDPEVRAAKAIAQAARTDLEKRNRLRDYYNVYYERMSALASSVEMKLALQGLKTSHLARLNQPRVRPSTDGALPTPKPTPEGKHKHKKHRK
jgi:hypothetical protein